MATIASTKTLAAILNIQALAKSVVDTLNRGEIETAKGEAQNLVDRYQEAIDAIPKDGDEVKFAESLCTLEVFGDRINEAVAKGEPLLPANFAGFTEALNAVIGQTR